MRKIAFNSFFHRLSALFFVVLLAVSGAWAQPPVPPKPSPPRLVNDFANMLSADEQSRLEQDVRAYNDSTSTQITIVTVPSLSGYDIAEWALEIGRQWGVGREGKNNGVVILAALEERKINISPGRGLEGALPDVLCGRIIDDVMKPLMKEKRYAEAFMGALTKIREAALGEFSIEDIQGEELPQWVVILIIILFVGLALLMVFGKARRIAGGRSYSGGGFFIGGGDFGGSSGSDSGGFDFGGGDFGGGGASGDW